MFIFDYILSSSKIFMDEKELYKRLELYRKRKLYEKDPSHKKKTETPLYILPQRKKMIFIFLIYYHMGQIQISLIK